VPTQALVTAALRRYQITSRRNGPARLKDAGTGDRIQASFATNGFHDALEQNNPCPGCEDQLGVAGSSSSFWSAAWRMWTSTTRVST